MVIGYHTSPTPISQPQWERKRSHKWLNSHWYVSQQSIIFFSGNLRSFNYRLYHQQSTVLSTLAHTWGQLPSSPLTHAHTTAIKSLLYQNWCKTQKFNVRLPHIKTNHPHWLSRVNNTNKRQPIEWNQSKIICAPERILQGLCLETYKHQRIRSWGHRTQLEC